MACIQSHLEHSKQPRQDTAEQQPHAMHIISNGRLWQSFEAFVFAVMSVSLLQVMHVNSIITKSAQGSMITVDTFPCTSSFLGIYIGICENSYILIDPTYILGKKDSTYVLNCAYKIRSIRMLIDFIRTLNMLNIRKRMHMFMVFNKNIYT